MVDQRKIALITPMGKKYSGLVDIPNSSLRTTDLLNSSTIYWKDPSEKCFENAVLLHDVQVMVDDTSVLAKYDQIQIKLSEVIYFYDELEKITDEKEKLRASSMVQKTQEDVQTVTIITQEASNSFFNITGTFFGLFKKKSNDNFIPLTDVKMIEIYKKEARWFQRDVNLPHKFIGVSTSHIEAARIS